MGCSCNPLGRSPGINICCRSNKRPLSQSTSYREFRFRANCSVMSHRMGATTQYACTRYTRHLRRIVFNPRGGLRAAQISTRRQYSLQNSTANGRPFRMAVIGSGPAGFYTSYKVLSKIENGTVDMYEHLPVPYGLVRFGVAPDHPEVKVCELRLRQPSLNKSNSI